MSIDTTSSGTELDASAQQLAAPLFFSAEENASFQSIRHDLRNYADYERGFQEVLMTLENDDILDAFSREYGNLHQSFLKSHEGEQRLVRKCEDLQSDIQSCMNKLQSAEELSAGDKRTIEQLQAELKRTRERGTQCRERESALKEKISKLRQEVFELEKKLAQPVELATREAALKSLERVHESVTREKESQEFALETLKHELDGAERRVQKLRESKAHQDAELATLTSAITATQCETNAVVEARNAKEQELRATRAQVTRLNGLSVERQRKLREVQLANAQHTGQMAQLMEQMEQASAEYQNLGRQIHSANAALQECNEDNDGLQRKVREAMAALQRGQAAVTAAHKHYVKESKLAEALQRRLTVAEQKRAEAEGEVEAEREAHAATEKKLADLQLALAEDEKTLRALHRERDLLHEHWLTAAEATARNANWLEEKRAQLHHTEHILHAMEEHTQRQSEDIFRVTRDCVAREEKIKSDAQRCAVVLNAIDAEERQMAAAQQDSAVLSARLKQQQSLLEAAVVDRNNFAKQFSDLRRQLAEQNRTLQLLINQTRQLQSEVAHRGRDVVCEEAALDAQRHRRAVLETTLQNLQHRIDRKSAQVQTFQTELRKLMDVVHEAKDEVSREEQRCRDVVHERDLLNGQLMQRGQSLVALYEKVHTQQAALHRAEAVYREKVQSLAEMEFQVASLSGQLQHTRQFIERLPDLRLLINKATRELNAERVKVRALLEEAQRPVNLHPNHALAWSEPDTFALSERVQRLQRELAARRAALTAAEAAVSEHEAVYMKAKAAVAQQPGPEMAEQLSSYQASLVKKQNQMQQLQQNLHFFREQTEHYRHRHDELRESLAQMARQYAAQRARAEAQAAANNNNSAAAAAAAASARAANTNTGEEEDDEEDARPLVYAGFTAPPYDAAAGEKAAQPLLQQQQEEQQQQHASEVLVVNEDDDDGGDGGGRHTES